MNTVDMMIIGAGIILLILFIFLKATKVPKQIEKANTKCLSMCTRFQ